MDLQKSLPTISVITTTFNAVKDLPGLIGSLRSQSDKNFTWVVADGGSTDGTTDLVNGAADIRKVVSIQPDFGIYDAMNRAIRLSDSEYYLVAGADDRLAPEAIEKYRAYAGKTGADIVTADVHVAGTVLRAREGVQWRYGLGGYISCHSVGALFRKSLHERFGSYSNKFPITADQYFVIMACRNGATRAVADFSAGEYSPAGTSSADFAGSLLESFRVKLLTEKNKFFQVCLFIARLIWHYRRL